MTTASLVITFLKAIPDLLALLKALQNNIDKAQSEEAMKRKVTDDLQKIHEAFNAQDPTKLRALFNN